MDFKKATLTELYTLRYHEPQFSFSKRVEIEKEILIREKKGFSGPQVKLTYGKSR